MSRYFPTIKKVRLGFEPRTACLPSACLCWAGIPLMTDIFLQFLVNFLRKIMSVNRFCFDDIMMSSDDSADIRPISALKT